MWNQTSSIVKILRKYFDIQGIKHSNDNYENIKVLLHN